MGPWTEWFAYLVGAAAIWFPWYIISKYADALRSARHPELQAAAKQKAIEMKHVVSATLWRRFQKEDGRGCQCIYHYLCNGKKYRFDIFNDAPPQEITLYYLKSPRKAAPEGSIVLHQRHWLLRYVIITAVIIFVARVLM